MNFEEADLNEIKLSMPLSIQFDLTYQCNLNCHFCYNSSGTCRKDEMNFIEWKELCDEIVRSGGVFQCILSGGEPLIKCRRMFQILDILGGDNTSFILNTNGTLITDDIADKLLEYRWYWIQISLDSYIESVHNCIRGNTMSYQKTVISIKKLISRGLPVVIACTLTNDNCDSIEEMAEFAADMGASGIIFSEVFWSGRASQNDIMNTNNRRKLTETVDMLHNRYIGRMDVNLGRTAEEEIADFYQKLPTGIVVRPNGDVKLNCVLPYIIGNIRKDSITDIWERVYRKEVIKSIIQNLDLNNKMPDDIVLF